MISVSRLRILRRQAVRRIVPYGPVVLLGLIIIIPIGLFIWLFFYTNVFRVQAVTVVDAREHTANAVREIIDSQIAKIPLRQNIFFVQPDVLEANIEAEITQVKNAHVVRKLPGTIKAIIQEKTPALLLLSNGQYFFVDQDGVPYEKASLDTLPGVVLPTVKNDDRGASVTMGVAVVEGSFVNFLLVLQEELPKTIGSEVAEIHIPSLSAREVHVTLNTNWQIRFDVTRPVKGQLEILQQLLTSVISREDQDHLQYIDLRIPNRIYYKASNS